MELLEELDLTIHDSYKITKKKIRKSIKICLSSRWLIYNFQ